VIAGKLKLYFNGSWTRLDTSYEILLKVVVDNGSDVDNATTDHVLSGVWRFEFSRSFPRRWTRLGVLEYSRIFPRRKLDTSSFSVGRLSNFFHTSTSVSSDFRFFGQSCSGVAGLATLLPPLKARGHLVDKSSVLGNVCLDDADRHSSSVGRLGIFFTRRPRSLLTSDVLAKVAQGWQDLLPCYPRSKLSGHLVDKSSGLGSVCLDDADRRRPVSTTRKFFSHVDLGLF